MDNVDIAVESLWETRGPVLLTGLNADDARHYVLRWRRAQLAAGRDPLLLVPSRRDAAELTLLISQEDGVLLGGTGVGTLDELVDAVLGERGRLFAPLEREFAVCQAGERLWSEQESIFGRLVRPLSGLANVLEELEETGLADQVIYAGLERWSRSAHHETSRRAAEALRVLWPGYRRVCAEWGVESRSRRTGRAASILATGGDQGRPWTRPVACFGFVTFTPAQRRLLSTLASKVPFLLELAWDGTTASKFLNGEVTHWLRLGAAHVCRRGDTGSEDGASVRLRLLRSSGRRGEVEIVAAEVVDLLRAGIPLGEIMVVARRAGMWRRLVEEVFGAYGIPVQMEAPARIADTGLGNAFLLALRWVRQKDTAAILSFLTSRYAEEKPAALSGPAQELLRDIQMWPDSPHASAVLEELFPVTWSRLRCCVEEEIEQPSAEDCALIDLARAMFSSAWAGRDLTSASAAEDARALRGIEAALERRAEHRSLAPALDGALLTDYLGDSLIWVGAGSAEGVLVTSASRVRTRRRKVVFVLGLVEQEFPEAEGGAGLLPPQFRRDCNRYAGVDLLEESAEGQDMFLFRLALSAANDTVYLSQRLADDDGGPLVESPFLETLRREGHSLPVWRTRTLADVTHEATRAPSPREFLRSCAAQGWVPEGVPEDGWISLQSVTRAGPVRLRDSVCLARLGEAGSWTVGEIEAYARCPIAWFLERVVGIDTPQEEGDLRELGTVTHQVLAIVYRSMMRRGLLPLEMAMLGEVLVLVEDALNTSLSRLRGRRSPAVLSLLAAEVRYRVKGYLRREAEQERRLFPTKLEYSLPAAGVDLEDDLIVRGRIDRVDESDDGTLCTVVDYKTGFHRPSRDWSASGALQVPLYMLALAHLYPEKRVVGGGYEILGAEVGEGILEHGVCDTTGYGDGWQLVPRSGLDTVLEQCRKAAIEVVRGMRSGYFDYPTDKKCPNFCRLTAICHRPAFEADR
ncbi:MAG: hypothetical protein GX604_01785 [Actinobacteria bacterium]|nr:hypothetical protein [Actinomycetota bacterium]